MVDANEQAATACRNALFLTDPDVDRESIISAKGTRVVGTCEWITHDAKYLAWLSDDNNGDSNDSDNTRLLWISGGPGKGKTMMSVFLTEELERHTARIGNANLVFLFCSAQDEKRNTAIAVLHGLVRQIIVKRPQLVKHALAYFETPERTQQTLGSLETLWLIFSKLIADAGLGKMFCVLDGLDECETNGLRTFLQKITGVFGSTSPSTNGSMFKLLVSSRVKPGLQRVARVQLDLDTNDRVADAIERFIVAQIEELTELVGLTEGVRTVVREVLLKRAEGTFLWVGFAMHELRKKQICCRSSHG